MPRVDAKLFPLAASLLALALVLSGCSSCGEEEGTEEDAASGGDTGAAAGAGAGEVRSQGTEAAPKPATGAAEAQPSPGTEMAEGARAPTLPAGEAGEDDGATGEDGAPGEDDEAAEPDGSKAPSPLEKRRKDREQRIAELKRRNEERRQERLARLAGDDEGETADGEGDAEHPEEPASRPEPRPGTRRAPPDREAGPPALNIDRYLNINDVRRVTGDRTLAPAGGLSGIPASPSYNSKYFAPPVRTKFGVSLQVWKERTRRDANERFRRMRRDYPNATDTSALPPKSFFSWWGDMMTISFTDLTKRIVISVTCSQDVCDGDQLLKLAETVKERL